MFYLHNSPNWLRWLFPSGLQWEGPVDAGNVVYLTFDDGPHPEATPFVLEQLYQFDMKATFFCIGKNVAQYPETFNDIKAQGHAVGNHTMHHVNGKITDAPAYVSNIVKADALIGSHLFRPPYGQITRRQVAAIRKDIPGMRLIMWSVLTGDFDKRLTGKQCFERSIQHIKKGAIIVLHDSEKAMPRLREMLPMLLTMLQKHGLQSCALS